MSLARIVLPVLLTLGAVPAAADTLTDLLPPDTKVVFGIRVHNLALSTVAQTFAAQAQAATAGWLKAVPLDGIDLLRDIDEVLIATSGKGPNPPAIIVVAGRFDIARLAENAKRYHEVPVLGGEADGGALVALLENGTALIGDPGLVRGAIDQRRSLARIDPALNDRITSLRQRYDVWGLGEPQPGLSAPMLPDAKVLESVDRFQFGMQLINGLDLAAELHVRSAEDAEKMHSALDLMAALVKGQGSQSAAKFDLQADGGTMKLNIFIPDEELKKAIAGETAALSPVSTQSAAPLAAEVAEAGPNGPTETVPVPVTAPEVSAPPAPAPPPASATAKPAPKAIEKEQDTVVLTLPGKK